MALPEDTGPRPPQGEKLPIPGVRTLAGPLSWAGILAGLPCLAAALALGALALEAGNAAAQLVAAIGALLVLQGVWAGPALLAGRLIRVAVPGADARLLRFGTLAPAFFVPFLPALLLLGVPVIALPVLFLGPALVGPSLIGAMSGRR